MTHEEIEKLNYIARTIARVSALLAMEFDESENDGEGYLKCSQYVYEDICTCIDNVYNIIRTGVHG